MNADATTITTGITAGRYARLVLTLEDVFVISTCEVAIDGHRGMIADAVKIRRMDGTELWVTPRALAPVTDDENLAAAVEWSTRTGQLTLITSGADLDALLNR